MVFLFKPRQFQFLATLLMMASLLGSQAWTSLDDKSAPLAEEQLLREQAKKIAALVVRLEKQATPEQVRDLKEQVSLKLKELNLPHPKFDAYFSDPAAEVVLLGSISLVLSGFVLGVPSFLHCTYLQSEIRGGMPMFVLGSSTLLSMVGAAVSALLIPVKMMKKNQKTKEFYAPFWDELGKQLEVEFPEQWSERVFLIQERFSGYFPITEERNSDCQDVLLPPVPHEAKDPTDPDAEQEWVLNRR